MVRIVMRELLLLLLCVVLVLAAFYCQASSPDYRWLLHGVTPFVGAAIVGGLAYTIFVKTWERWVPVPFMLCAATSFVELFARVGW
jgi:hypothetical protein